MIRPHKICAFLLAVPGVGLAACDLASGPKAMTQADLRAEIVAGARPVGPEGACWAGDETPAVVETTTEQIALPAPVPDAAGYRTETRQKILQPRAPIWFRTPCDPALTPEVIATLQRALAARGYFTAPISGTLDAATRAAIRAYQAPRGLNSDQLSLATARQLGVIAADLGQKTLP